VRSSLAVDILRSSNEQHAAIEAHTVRTRGFARGLCLADFPVQPEPGEPRSRETASRAPPQAFETGFVVGNPGLDCLRGELPRFGSLDPIATQARRQKPEQLLPLRVRESLGGRFDVSWRSHDAYNDSVEQTRGTATGLSFAARKSSRPRHMPQERRSGRTTVLCRAGCSNCFGHRWRSFSGSEMDYFSSDSSVPAFLPQGFIV
jgi:hypothetical protein